MLIDIQARGFILSETLRDYAKRRLQFALARASGRVRRVIVRMHEIGTPDGNRDTACRIRVTFKGSSDVIVNDVERDIHFAIVRATDRTRRAVTRAVHRVSLPR